MNTFTGSYLTRFSSGTIAALLILSSFLFIVPFAPQATAANAQFSAAFTYPYVVVGTSGAVRTITVTNPLGNLGIVEVDVNVPASAAQMVTGGAFVDGFVNTGTAQVAGSGPWTVVYPGSSSGATILPAGASGHISFTFSAATSKTTATITVTVRYSDGSTQSNTLTLYEGLATSVTVTSTGTTFTAGASVPLTATVSPTDSGVPLTFTSSPSVSAVIAAGFSASFTPSSGSTSSSGVLTSTFVSTEAGSYTLSADAGKAYSSDSNGKLTVSTQSITYNPGPPTQVVVSTPYDNPAQAVAYVSSQSAATLGLSLADQYGNAVTTSASGTVTFSALQGTVNPATGTVTNGVLTTTNQYTPSKSGVFLAFGTFDLISATLTVPMGPLAGTYSGSSKQLSIGYLATGTAIPAITITRYQPSVGGSPATGFGNAVAGSTVNLAVALSVAQKGVPVNFSLKTDPSSLNPYAGTFANGKSWIVVYTNSNGVASANFTADTTAGDAADAVAVVSEPVSSSTTYNPSNTASSPVTGAITTIAAAPTRLKILTYFDSALTISNSYVKPGGSLFLNVKLQDSYGNSVSWGGTSALQISLSATSGGFSATTVYITAPNGDTQGSGYSVQYVAPTSLGDVTLTASTTFPSISAGTKTVHVVSPNPSVFITSPTNSTTSHASMTFSGYAMPSKALPGVVVATLKYSLNGAANVSTPITGTNASGAAFFSFTVSLVNGTNTVKVYATDSQGNTGVTTYTIARVPPPPPVVFANSVQVQGTPSLTTLAGFKGVSATYKNLWNTTLNVIVFAVWKNSAGQTVAVTTGGLTLAPGQNATAFAPLTTSLPSGTYTVNVFVVTTDNKPVSVTTTVTVTL